MLNKLFSSSNSFINLIKEKLTYTPQPTSYDMLFKDPKDGCALYDDLWGA